VSAWCEVLGVPLVRLTLPIDQDLKDKLDAQLQAKQYIQDIDTSTSDTDNSTQSN
jgi:hypothetical protein